MTAIADAIDRHSFSLAQYFICLKGIVWREALRFIQCRRSRTALGRITCPLVETMVVGFRPDCMGDSDVRRK